MAKIADVQEVSLDALVPYERNAKIHGEAQIEKLMASIREFGFLTPCLIDRGHNIIAGHGRVMAAKALGMETVPCVFIEGLTDAQRRAYILADNRLGELGEWDMEIVTDELIALNDEDFTIELTGFDVGLLVDAPDAPDEGADPEEDVERLDTHYGVPYQGNKSRIADIIITTLPAGKRLVDLFGGGGAITHCALLSGKWDSIMYNDPNEMITGLFVDAVNGKYHDERRVITREDFERDKETDAYVKYIWSFGNDGRSYLWGKKIEGIKCAACHALLDSELTDRRLAFKDFVRLLTNDGKLSKAEILEPGRLQSLERLQALTQLEALQRLEALHRLEVSNVDYRDYAYQDGDVVYCDVPYEKQGSGKCDDYGVLFDSIAFYEWVESRPFPVYFSSYEISEAFSQKFYKKRIKAIARLMGAHTNETKTVEYLYSNRPFAGGSKA